jgi:hypothetical protein
MFWRMRNCRLLNEHEGIVCKLYSRQLICVHHQLDRFYPVTHRGSDTRIGARSRPCSEAGRNHNGGNAEQTDLVHLNSLYDFSFS